MVTDHRLYEEKISNFQALLEVSYWQEMSLFMDDLRTSSFPVFKYYAGRSWMTTSGVFPQIDEHLAWITPYFEGNYSNGYSFGASNIEHRGK